MPDDKTQSKTNDSIFTRKIIPSLMVNYQL